MNEEFFQPLVSTEYGDEVEFNGFIRKHLICGLSGLFLYLFGFYIIRCFITRNDNDELYAGDEDFLVYRVSVWMCSASLAVAFGANVLLPFSMIGREIVFLYPNNFYTNWLNSSLIVSMWNYVFFFSNVSLFVFLPFSYFFIESQGLSFYRRPQRPFLARVYETLLVCVLVIVVLIGIVDVVYSLLLQHSLISFSLFYFASLSTPLLYSFVSSLGVFILLLSTPFGFVKMFDVFSDSLNTSMLENDGDEGNDNRRVGGPKISATSDEFMVLTSVERLQAKSLERRQRHLANGSAIHQPNNNGQGSGLVTLSYQNACDCRGNSDSSPFLWLFDFAIQSNSRWSTNLFGNFAVWTSLRPKLKWCLLVWNLLKHPIMMLILIFFLCLAVTMVTANTLRLFFGFSALPVYVQYVDVDSRHIFGIVGVLVEIVVMLYIILASFVGVYSLPLIRNIRPIYGRTSMTGIILNCCIVLLLSSALPVLARILDCPRIVFVLVGWIFWCSTNFSEAFLGITSFDLLGAYGQIEWISNFMLVISYNMLFVGSSIFCLVNKFTLPVRREVMRRFASLCSRERLEEELLQDVSVVSWSNGSHADTITAKKLD